MDPLSILASATSICAAGVAAATALSSLASRIKHAPKEIAMLSQTMLDLSIVLDNIKECVDNHPGFYKPELVQVVKSSIWQFKKQQDAVKKLLKRCSKNKKSLKRIAWMMSEPKARSILLKLDGLKITLNTVLLALTVARQVQQEKE
jgi:Fungal N-terminal domain of STAND proteins